MRIDPYLTTICRPYPTRSLVGALQRANIETPLPPLETPLGHRVRQARVITPSEAYDDVAGFTQFLNIAREGKDPIWVVDGRPFMRWNRREDSYRLTAANDYSFQISRLCLTQVAATHEQGFYRLGDIPIKTFVRWITLAISQRFNLGLEYQLRLQVICAYYYHALQSGEVNMDDSTKVRLSQSISRVVSVPPDVVMEVGDKLGKLENGDDLAHAIAEHSGSVRLAKLKFTDLYMLIAASWVGTNSRENAGVALEHFPTFIAMVYSALGEKSYRKTRITQRAETAGRQADHRQFVQQVYRLVESRFE